MSTGVLSSFSLCTKKDVLLAGTDPYLRSDADATAALDAAPSATAVTDPRPPPIHEDDVDWGGGGGG